MNETNDQETHPEEEEMSPFPSDLFEKAQRVHERITQLKDEIDQSVFVGASKDGLFLIALYGDGRPKSVSLRLDLPAEEKKRLENEVFEAIEDAYQCRMDRLAEGMDSIQKEVGIGPDFQLPF